MTTGVDKAGIGKALENKGMTIGAGKIVNKNAKSASTNWQKELKLWYKKLKVDKREAKSFNIFVICQVLRDLVNNSK